MDAFTELVQSTEVAIEMLEGEIMDAIYRGRLEEAANLARFQSNLQAGTDQYWTTRRLVEEGQMRDDKETTHTELRRTQAFARIREQLAPWDGVSGGLYWLSFVDEDAPENQRFAGACIVRAPSMDAAAAVAHTKGCNPGGQVAMLEFPEPLASRIADNWKNRLLSRADVAAFGSEYYRPDTIH